MPKEATKENSGYDIHNLVVHADDNLAFAHSVNHCYGPMGDGKTMDMWARGTQCFKKMGGKWYIVHEQYSLPVDFESGRALMNLRPDNLFN
jgi:ketosteroid isomerase-like protein